MLDSLEIGIEGHFKDKILPNGPLGSGGDRSTRSDAGLDAFLHKAEVTAGMI